MAKTIADDRPHAADNLEVSRGHVSIAVRRCLQSGDTLYGNGKEIEVIE